MKIKNLLTLAIAAICFLVAAIPASAQGYRGWHGGGYHGGCYGCRGNNLGNAIVTGLVIGLAEANAERQYYAPPPAYYPPPVYGAPAYYPPPVYGRVYQMPGPPPLPQFPSPYDYGRRCVGYNYYGRAIWVKC